MASRAVPALERLVENIQWNKRCGIHVYRGGESKRGYWIKKQIETFLDLPLYYDMFKWYVASLVWMSEKKERWGNSMDEAKMF